MPHTSFTADIQTEIIQNKLIAGNYIVRIGSSHGAIAELANQKPTLRSRSAPTLIRQPPVALLEREHSIQEAITALKSRQTVEFYSVAGFGKTFILRSLAKELQASFVFAEGVISLSPHHPYVGDLLQSIWEAFYESDILYKPTDSEIQKQISNKQALVILDDNDKLIQDEVHKLRNAAIKCTFLVASSKQRFKKKQGYFQPLSGLSSQDALAFVEEKMQRSLRTEELPAVRTLCMTLKGNPMHLQLAIAYMLAEGRSLAEIVSQLPNIQASTYLIQQIIDSLTPPQRSILDLLAMMGGVGLVAEEIAAITQQKNTLDLLRNLQQRHLIQQEGSLFIISQTVAEVLPPSWKLEVPLENATAYFKNWTQQYQRPQTLLTKVDAIVQILEVAVRSSRWQNVLHLVQAVESSLALSKRWGLWEQVLQRGLQASQAQRDKASEAWALHQLGTRALCLEENSTAATYLTKAMLLRQSLGDEPALAATRHNCNLLPSDLVASAQHQNIENSSSEIYTILEPETTPKVVSQPIEQPKINSTKNTHQPQVNNQSVTTIKNVNPLPSSSSPMLTRMNIVASQIAPSEEQPLRKNFLLSPQGIIAIAILASSGILAWLHWHRFTPPPTQSDTNESQRKIQPSTKTKSQASTTPSSIVEPTSSAIPRFSPLTDSKPRIDPALKPSFPEPTFIKPKQSKTKPPSAPAPQYSPQPTATSEPASTLASPSSEPLPPSLFEESSSSTPSFTPTPGISVTPIKESFNQQ